MNNVKPHGAWFLLVPFFLFGGLIVTILVVAMTASGISDGMQRAPVPGETTIKFDQAGDQTLFFEQEGYKAVPPLSLEWRVVPAAGGDSLPMDAGGMSSTYSINGRSGVRIATVRVPAPGTYRLESRLGEGEKAPPGAALMIGTNAVAGALGAVFGALGVMGLSFVAALVSLIVILVKRSGSRKRLQQQQYAPMQMQQQMQQPQQYPQQPPQYPPQR